MKLLDIKKIVVVLALGFVFIDYGWAQTCAVPGYLTPSQSCGAITNSGTVSTAGDVVYSDGSIVSITNTGTIASTGVGNNGFYTSIDSVGLGIGASRGANSATLGTLDNFGTISASNSSPQDMNAAIAAHGTITNLNNYGSGILSGFFGVVTTNLISNFSNAGHIAGFYEGIHLFGGSAITSLDNSSSGVISGGYIGIENQGGTIGAFTNEGTVTGGVVNTGSIGSITTAGSIDHLYNGTNSTIGGGSSASALSISAGGSVGTVANFGNISPVSPNYAAILLDGGSITGGFTNAATGSISAIGNNAIRLVGTSSIVGGLANSGSISSTSNAISVNATSAIDSITNTGSIYSTGGGSGILNSGTIGTLNNAQGAGNSNGPLTLSSRLPSNYNIVINSVTDYGQLLVTSPSGSMAFNIDSSSSLTPNHTYLDVLQGFSTLGSLSNTTGSYSGQSWSLIADSGNPGYWNLAYAISVPATNISGAGTIYQSSNLGSSVNPVFDGGTLQVTSGYQSIANNFTINANNGVIDQNGSASIFSGVISNAVSNTPGSLSIINTSNNGGSVTFTNTNTYTGSTTIGSRATLALAGTGSIATSSGVANSGTFDISNTTSGTSVQAISGTGAVALGSKNLAITNAAGNLSGAVTGSGGINITGGTQTLSGNNSGFTGGVQVQSGASLSIPAANALGSGTLALVGGSLAPATLNVTGTTTIANYITVAGDPVFNVATGTTTTASSPITDGGVAGDVVVAGGGTLNLTAVNTYTGLTAIGAGSTLALSGNGSITPSVSVTNNGTFNVSGKTGNVALGGSFTQTSTGGLVIGFSPTANQRVTVAGAAALAGSLSLVATSGTYSAGKYTLLTANGVAGTFGSLSSNLNNYTNLAYSLSYDANDVYLNILTNGPSTSNTQQSLANTVQAVQSTFTILNTALTNSFSYDCNEFGANGVCISAGGRNTAVSAANGLNNTSALLIAAYRPSANYRIGAYADQNLSVNNAGSTVNLGNNTPLIGLFGAWNERLDGAGTEVKVSAAYGQKNATVTRSAVGTGATASEAGNGGAPINSQGAQITAKYGFGVAENVIVSPYIGMRYTQNNMNGYTEGTSATVTAPLTYSALNTNATTALAGIGASYKFIPQAGAFASAGVETDTNTANGSYYGTNSTIAGLTPVNFNSNPVKTRPTAMLGAYYDVEKNQRLGINAIYRQEPYQGVSTTTVMATYTVGL